MTARGSIEPPFFLVSFLIVKRVLYKPLTLFDFLY